MVYLGVSVISWGNSTIYSKCVYGMASHMSDFLHCAKCMLKCLILDLRKMWYRGIDEGISAYSRQLAVEEDRYTQTPFHSSHKIIEVHTIIESSNTPSQMSL